MNITVSRRQHKLYNDRGFELEKWQTFIEEANALRKEIKLIADEYGKTLLSSAFFLCHGAC